MIVPSNIKSVDCSTSNCIYLLTCMNCHMQYVGETEQTLRGRFTGHRSAIRNSNKPNMCRILCEHFQKGLCKSANYSVQMIEVLENSVDRDTTTKLRRKRETHWIRTLRTAYPYGLNGKIGDDFPISEIYLLLHIFHLLREIRTIPLVLNLTRLAIVIPL